MASKSNDCVTVRGATGVVSDASVWLFVPVHRDVVGVRRESILVGLFVVVQVRREVEEDGLFVADDCEAVPAVTEDADGLLVVLANDEMIDLTLRGGVLAVVVDADFDAILLADEMVDPSTSRGHSRRNGDTIETVNGRRGIGYSFEIFV